MAPVKLTATQMKSLAEVVAKTQQGPASAENAAYLVPASAKPLVDAGYIQGNNAVKQGNKIAYRATPQGVAAHAATNEPQGGNAASGSQSSGEDTGTQFAVVKFDLPPIQRGRINGGRYPFETMGVGEAFFVPATEDRKNPAKSLAGTVTSANGRLAPKEFSVRSIKDGAPFGHAGVAGAAVGRVA